MLKWRKRPALEQSTSEHLTRAFKKLHGELRRAGAGKKPDAHEAALLGQLAEDLRRLAGDEHLSRDLRAALEGVARTADWIKEAGDSPPPIVDLGLGGG